MSQTKTLLDAWAALESTSGDVPIDSVLNLCGSKMLAFPSEHGGLGHVAFVEQVGVRFHVLVCLVAGREYRSTGACPVTHVWPTFLFMGRTFEGLTEVRAKPDMPSVPLQLAEQLCLAQKAIAERGWDDV